MVADISVDRIVVEELFALGAPSVVLIAAEIANINVITIFVDSERNFISKEIFIALIAEQVFIGKATGANIGAVMNHSHLAFVVVFFAMFAKTVVFVKAMVADLNAFTVAVENFPSFRRIIFAFLTEFAIIVVAVVAKKFVRKFAGARNAKSVSPNIENLEVVGTVLPNGNFGVEFGMKPVDITAKAVAAPDLDSVFVTAIFFGLPEIGNLFQLGNFTLNKVAIKFGFGLSTTSSTARVVETTLKQEPVVRLVSEDLPSSLAIVERFGVVGVGGSEHNESNVVASIADTAAVVVAIHDVEGVAGNQSGAALVVLRVAHRQEMRGVYRHEKLEVNLLAGKLIGELREEMLELTACAQICDTEGIANRLENPTALFARSVGVRRELIDSVDVVVGFVVGAREEADGAFNQGDFVASGVQFDRIQNGMGKVVNEGIVGVVGLGAVDDDCLQVFVPALRLAEEFAQGAFAVDRISSEAVDEFCGNIFVNVFGIGMAEVIVQSRPNVVAGEFLEFVHFEDLRK